MSDTPRVLSVRYAAAGHRFGDETIDTLGGLDEVVVGQVRIACRRAMQGTNLVRTLTCLRVEVHEISAGSPGEFGLTERHTFFSEAIAIVNMREHGVMLMIW